MSSQGILEFYAMRWLEDFMNFDSDMSPDDSEQVEGTVTK